MKISTTQVIRRISQAITFVLFAGMFSLAFSGLQAIYHLITGKSTDVSGLQMFIVPLAVATVLTLLFGRFFCGWICGFGTLNDFIYLISKKLFKFRFRISPKLDAVLKYLKYAVLFFIIIFVWQLGTLKETSFSPWAAMDQIGDFAGTFLMMPLAYFLLLVTVVGAMFVERFFCRYLCPLGAFFVIGSRFNFSKINKPKEQCGKCRACTNACSMGINLAQLDKVYTGECINCLRCVDVCPRKNAKIGFFMLTFDRVSYVIMAVLVFIVINLTGEIVNLRVNAYGSTAQTEMAANDRTTETGTVGSEGDPTAEGPAGTSAGTSAESSGASSSNPSTTPSTSAKAAASSKTPAKKPDSSARAAKPTAPATRPAATTQPQKQTTAASTTQAQTNKLYKDGTYEGTARGWRPGLTVSVTVKNDRITGIQIVSNRETPRYAQQPLEIIPQEIIDAQSTGVDAVSGATFTSTGIMNAVADALSQAKI